MKILLFGANGQVGWELRQTLKPFGQLVACDRETTNLEDFDQLRAIIRENNPDIIVNAAAYTAVDKAEAEPEKANRINAEAVDLIANETKNLNAWLLHYSTDYVFDGRKLEAYTETDKANPESIYGKTKFTGEENIRDSGCQHLIFRTSWVYGSHGSNFVKTILQLAKTNGELKIVNDQIGTPTSAEFIANVTAQCLEQVTNDTSSKERMTGTYHLTASATSNRFEVAKFIVSEAVKSGMTLSVMPDDIMPITTNNYSQQAKRPANSQLNCAKIISTFNVKQSYWKDDVVKFIAKITEMENL